MNWVDENIATTVGILGDLSLVMQDERRRRGLSLRDVERESGVSLSYLWRVEKDDANPSMEIVQSILQWVLQSRAIPVTTPNGENH